MYDSVTHSCVDQKREPMNKAGQGTFTPSCPTCSAHNPKPSRLRREGLFGHRVCLIERATFPEQSPGTKRARRVDPMVRQIMAERIRIVEEAVCILIERRVGIGRAFLSGG
jgi:hypothetical protein